MCLSNSPDIRWVENRRKADAGMRRKLQIKSASANIFLIYHEFGADCFSLRENVCRHPLACMFMHVYACYHRFGVELGKNRHECERNVARRATECDLSEAPGAWPCAGRRTCFRIRRFRGYGKAGSSRNGGCRTLRAGLWRRAADLASWRKSQSSGDSRARSQTGVGDCRRRAPILRLQRHCRSIWR
jgi:hypothetical protein